MDGNSPGAKRYRTLSGRVSNTEVDKEKDLNTIELEHVLGISVYSGSALTCHPMSGLVAYPAGCVLVLLDSVKNKQVATLHTPRKSITAASFSPDGRYVLTGETGLQPAVRVWDISRMLEIASLKGHSVGIASVSFSPSMREIIVVGDAQDMIISVWAWPGKTMKALNKFSDTIYAMDVSEDSSYFVTVGNRHIKFYNLDTLKLYASHIEAHFPIPLPTRCGLLDNLKDNCFCDVVCGRGKSSFYIFVVAISGILCQVNRNRLLERWVDVNMTKACCIDADEDSVFVGGAQGMIRIFHALSLQIILTLPRPHSLGLDIAEVSPGTNNDATNGHPVVHPGTRALAFDSVHANLTVVYDDHSLYVWGRETKEWTLARGGTMILFKKRYSSLYHKGCVWDVSTYPVLAEAQTDEGDTGGALPPGALISVSSDGTLRAWDMCANICEESLLKRNCLSSQCLKIVYTNQVDQPKKLSKRTRLKRNAKDGGSSGTSTPGFRKLGKQSFNVVAVCPNGIDIAAGNRFGRINIYDANTMKLKTTMLAHEAEVTAIKYSSTHRFKVLASGSRDRMIHVMDASRGYQLLTTLDDHSSTITSIRFTHISRCLMLVSSSLDKSVLIRAYLDSSTMSFKPVRAIVEKKSVMDFAIHPWSGLLALACQDKQVRVYSMLSSIEDNSFRGCPKCGGQLIKIEIDPSGQYLLTACSNKTVNLLQFSNGQMISTINGHAESVTSINFSHNMKHVITSAIDGCIFLWRLPQCVTYTVRKEMAEMGRLTKGMVLNDRWKKSRLLDTNLSRNELNIEQNNNDLVKTSSSNCNVVSSIVDNRMDGVQYHMNEKGTKDNSSSNIIATCSPVPEIDENINTTTTSDAWLNACDERRRKFKLEAQSIHKILAMMRLVTEAMEKDLANADWIICPPEYNHPLPVSQLKPSRQQHQASDGSVQMIFTNSLPPGGLWTHRTTLENLRVLQAPPRRPEAPGRTGAHPDASALGENTNAAAANGQGENVMCASKETMKFASGPCKMLGDPRASRGLYQEERSESSSSVYDRIQRDWCNYHVCKQENKSYSNSFLAKPLERMTIKLSTDANGYQCVGTFAFFNELEGFNYSSAVNHITQALETKQRQDNRTLLLNSSALKSQEGRGIGEGIEEKECSCKDDMNKNNVFMKISDQASASEAPAAAGGEAQVMSWYVHNRQFGTMQSQNAMCNLSLAVGNSSQSCEAKDADFGTQSSSGGVLSVRAKCGSLTRGAESQTGFCESARNARMVCTLKLDAVSNTASSSGRECLEDVVFDFGISFKALFGDHEQVNENGPDQPTSTVTGKDSNATAAAECDKTTSETSETVVTATSREQLRAIRHSGKKKLTPGTISIKDVEENLGMMRNSTSGDSESPKSSDSKKIAVCGGCSLVSRCGEGDVALEKLLLKPDTVHYDCADT